MSSAPKAKKLPTSMLLSPRTKADIEYLAERIQLSHAGVIAMLISEAARKARAEDVAAPAEPPPPAAPAPKKRRA